MSFGVRLKDLAGNVFLDSSKNTTRVLGIVNITTATGFGGADITVTPETGKQLFVMFYNVGDINGYAIVTASNNIHYVKSGTNPLIIIYGTF